MQLWDIKTRNLDKSRFWEIDTCYKADIGSGGMATIHRARDLQMDRVVAVKVLREIFSTDPKFVARFQREARAASVLKHPNIVRVFDYGQH